MSFTRKIKYFLVHRQNLGNKEAQKLIDNGLVDIDGQKIVTNCEVSDHSEIRVNGIIVRQRTELVYLKFHKPPGFESTMNTKIPDNLAKFFPGFEGLAIAGRLDKQSEGLLLVSNDGKWVEKMCNPKFEKEKEYIVTLDELPNDQFTTAFANGVRIGGHTTLPCICEVVGRNEVRVVLTEGKNRQIRRMCRALGFKVKRLNRVKIDIYQIGLLNPGETEQII